MPDFTPTPDQMATALQGSGFQGPLDAMQANANRMAPLGGTGQQPMAGPMGGMGSPPGMLNAPPPGPPGMLSQGPPSMPPPPPPMPPQAPQTGMPPPQQFASPPVPGPAPSAPMPGPMMQQGGPGVPGGANPYAIPQQPMTGVPRTF